MTLTEALFHWVTDAERMSGLDAEGVVVSGELHAALVAEQGSDSPVVADLIVLVEASSTDAGDGLALSERREVEGPDRVTLYVGTKPEDSGLPLGFDPAMPVVFVPVPPGALDDSAQLEMYNRLRWLGIPPDEALGGSR